MLWLGLLQISQAPNLTCSGPGFPNVSFVATVQAAMVIFLAPRWRSCWIRQALQ